MRARSVEQALALAPDEVGPALLALPEDQWLDRQGRRIAPKDLANHLVGMANADGGSLIVGLAGGAVEGLGCDVPRGDALRQAPLDLAVPPVRARTRTVACANAAGGTDRLLVFEVEPGETVHANQRGEVFLRVGADTRRLSFAQRQELVFDRGQATYEARSVRDASLADADAELLEGYARTLGQHPGRLMAARGLARGEALTVAGCLLFAEHPQRWLPEASVRVLRYRSGQRGTGRRQQLVADTRLEGPIPRQLVAAVELVREHQPARRALVPGTGRFGPVALVPEDAWLEALINAVVHRSYSLGGDHVRVEVFDDRIEVESPGRFPGLADLRDPTEVIRFARNPRVARVCADLSFGQEPGEGIRRMFDEMRAAGLGDPVYRQTAGSVRVTLPTDPVDRELQARLPGDARAIMTALREADRLSTGEMAQVLGVSRVTAGERLGRLRDEGLVVWVGKSPKDPRAHWRLAPT